MSAEGYRVAV